MSGFRDSTIYQVYIKSFMDFDGDGIGDIKGVTGKLDYLKNLGVDYVWLTPFFKSPLNDNGYDVEDYTAIDPVFGTMKDVEELIAEANKRSIGLMFDMVFNHTSTKHQWFRRALAGEEKYMNYYIFKKGTPELPPTNWKSKFGGSAWKYVPHLKRWYLHLFDETQADLNWENPEVREELKKIILFWKNKGLKGFRFDVVNLISKPELFENDLLGDGRRFYTDGPHVHEYLKELVEDTGIADMVTVGEMSSTSLGNCIRYSSPAEKELSMVFSFHHLKVDYKEGMKWELQPPDYKELKKLFETWQMGMQEGNGWNALFWCNHDQPRIVSRFGDDKKYWKESAKMLATCIHLLRGTPYVYQGEELGMTNAHYETIEEYRDVESINYYQIMLEHGKTKEEALQILAERSRDNARTPMQWSNEKEAGFTVGKPWIKIPDNYRYINAVTEQEDSDSILSYYKKLISLRKQMPVIQDGKVEFLEKENSGVFAFKRYTETEELLVYNNLTAEIVKLQEKILLEEYKCILHNLPEKIKGRETIEELQSYESVVFYKRLR